MFKKNKTPTATAARYLSKKGAERKINETVNTAIKILDKDIKTATTNGYYKAWNILANHSGYLTLEAVNRIAEYYRSLNYSVDFHKDNDSYDTREKYYIEICWEEAAC